MDYYVSLADAAEHIVHVRMHLAGIASQREVQLPAWNALYQIRDFSQNLRRLHASDETGHRLPVESLNKNTWRITHAEDGAEVEYDIVANQPGPYGAQVDSEHGFFNLAEILVYPVDARSSRTTVTFNNLPVNWRIAVALPQLRGAANVFVAADYDHLVDAPVEIGNFRESSFALAGSTYRVVVDSPECDVAALVATVRKIVATATEGMQDRPTDEYLFIYHFPHNRNGGGMEHANSTAIDLDAGRLEIDPMAMESVTAHEFFHAWNVKRIRPATLEPIDYTRENYTRALWFSEGATSVAADLILLRAGLMSEQQFRNDIASEIRSLEMRPAHRWQSAEEASVDVWLERYPGYQAPERSISYYNKGYLLTLLLDLEIRRASNGSRSLRELFQWMNEHYAKRHDYFKDSEGVRAAGEAITGHDLSKFFQAYVSGTEEPPYNELFNTVGLQVIERKALVPVLGFELVQNFDAAPQVVSVDPQSDAARLGIVVGDRITRINGRLASHDLDRELLEMHPGDYVKLLVDGTKGTRTLKVKLSGREELRVSITDLPNATPAQRKRRAAWLAGEAEK